MADTITGTFPDRASAEHALAILSSSGFNAHIASSPNGDQGGVLVTVDAQGNAADAQHALLNAGASRVDPADAQSRDASGTIGGFAPSSVTDAPPQRDMEQGSIGGLAPSSVTDAAPSPNLTADYPENTNTIGGFTPDALTDAPSEPNTDERSIGGIAPSAVTNTEPPTSSMATSNNSYDTQARQPSGTPADSTIVSPGMETPYTERQAQNGDTTGQHPVTDEDIIAEARREREQSADLDVPPTSDGQNASPRPNQ